MHCKSNRWIDILESENKRIEEDIRAWLLHAQFANNVYESEGKLDEGFNFISYNLMNNSEYLDKGVYKVLIITDKDNLEKEFEIQ